MVFKAFRQLFLTVLTGLADSLAYFCKVRHQ